MKAVIGPHEVTDASHSSKKKIWLVLLSKLSQRSNQKVFFKRRRLLTKKLLLSTPTLLSPSTRASLVKQTRRLTCKPTPKSRTK